MITLFCLAALAAEPDYRSHLDQARFFVKRGWVEDAREELERATATEDGRLDPDVWWLLANVHLELGDLSRALEAADRAQTHARDEAVLHAASALASFLRTSFGRLEVDSNPGGLTTRLAVTTSTQPADPAIAAYVHRVQEEAADGLHRLPYALDVPAGTFVVNDVEVVVEPGQTVALVLEPEAIIKGRGSQLWRLDLSVGSASWVGASHAHGPLSPLFGAALRRPFGPLSMSFAAAWRPLGYRRPDVRPVYDLSSASVVALAGLEKHLRGSSLLMSVGYQVATIPAVELACSTDGWTCAVNERRDLLIYPRALAHGPLLSARWQQGEANRKDRWTPGVEVRGGAVQHAIPPTGEVEVVGLPSVAYSVTASDQRGIAADIGLAITLSHGL